MADADQFLALCKELRKLGAVKVEGHGFSAIFPVGTPQPVATQPRPRKGALNAKKAEPELSAEEAREQAYRRELGIS